MIGEAFGSTTTSIPWVHAVTERTKDVLTWLLVALWLGLGVLYVANGGFK